MMGTMMQPNGRTNRLRPFLWGGAACLLLLPAIAMQLGAEGVHWTMLDFVVMGMLLALACGLYELGAWISGNLAYRAGFGLAVLTGFLTIWVNLAVGMLGSEDNIANLMFLGVLAVAGVGAMVARFRSSGMARVMAATAVAQLLVVAAAMTAGGFELRELTLTATAALPWLLAATLFQKAATDQAR